MPEAPQSYPSGHTLLLNVEATAPSSQAPWTAARCQRLLRPLSSKIALLRKEKEMLSAVGRTGNEHKTSLAVNGSCNHGILRKSSESSKMADEDWAPNPRPRKKMKRMYSSKSSSLGHLAEPAQQGSRESRIKTPVEISIPDDYICRKADRSPTLGTPSSSQEPIQENGKLAIGQTAPMLQNSRSTRTLQGLSMPSVPSSQRTLFDGICKGLESLLKATEAPSTLKHCAVPSLFNTCLRNVPARIAEEQRWCQEEDPESDVDMSSKIYMELELLSTSTTGDWKPLRQIVRAHGVRLIEEAIKEGLISPAAAQKLIALCICQKSYHEAQRLVESLINSMKPLQSPTKASDGTGMILRILDEFASVSGRCGFRYQQLASMLSRNLLPINWIARHDMIGCWNHVVQSLTQQDEHAGPAGVLLRSAILKACGSSVALMSALTHEARSRGHGSEDELDSNSEGQTLSSETYQSLANYESGHDDSDRASTTISSLLTVLCAIGLLQSAAVDSASGQPHMSSLSILHEISIDAEQWSEISRQNLRNQRLPCAPRMAIPLVASGLVQATTCGSMEVFGVRVAGLFDAMKHMKSDNDVIEEGSSFLCAVADCCAKARLEDTFTHIQRTVQHVRHIAESLKTMTTSYDICSRMALAAAFEYAESTKHPKHLHWALDLEQSMTGANIESSRRSPGKTPMKAQAQHRDGYRWEAGICEWVAKTPAIAPPKPQTRSKTKRKRRNGRNGDSENPPPALERSLSSNSVDKPSDSSSEFGQVTSATDDFDRSKPTESQGTVYFSHIYIDCESDQLSTPESSQEAQVGQCPKLREVKNLGINSDKRDMLSGHRKTETGLWSKPLRSDIGLKKSESRGRTWRCWETLSDSEDELSFL